MIVDAHNQFLRSYIVDPSLSTDGRPIGGCKGFLKILNKLTREIKPDMIVVVWDGEGGSAKRRASNKNYKAGRKPLRLNRSIRTLTEEEEHENKIWQQMEAIECLNETPVIQFMEPLGEADDVIAYLTGHVFDSRDEGTKQRLEILKDVNGAFRCRTAFNCTSACPRGIQVTKAIEDIKRETLLNS